MSSVPTRTGLFTFCYLLMVKLIIDSMIDLNQIQSSDAMPSPDGEAYRSHATQVIRALRSKGFVNALEQLVEAESNPYFQDQAEVIIHARAARKLDVLKAKMKDKHDLDEAKVALIHYNHAVRNLIWNNPGTILTDDLTSWMRDSTGDGVWAEGIVSGATGEVAVARTLKGLGGVKRVRLGTFEEDLKGMDVVVELSSGDLISVDVKTRNHLSGASQFIKMPPTWIHNRRYHHCEMVVEIHHINGAAILDERAHRTLLNDMQDYLYGFIDRKRRSVVV